MSFLSLTTDTWNSLGTWIAAVGTVGATGMAVRSARQARTIAEQGRADALEVRREEAAAKKIDQASKVCAWTTMRLDVPRFIPGKEIGERARLELSNSSSQPVFEVTLYLVWVQGAGPSTGEDMESFLGDLAADSPLEDVRAVAQVLPPGEYSVTLHGPHTKPPQGILGVEIAFTDSAGHHWLRRAATGDLIELHNPPTKHYGMLRPLVYVA